MTNAVFNDPDYLELEAARQGGQSELFDLGNGMTAGLIGRHIADGAGRDLVSVYGYPDLALATSPLPVVDADSVLAPLAEAARGRGLIAAYLRLGLTQDVAAPSGAVRGCDAVQVDVGEVVVVDVAGGPEAAIQAYRKQLRNELRRPSSLVIEPSNDYAAFHEIYTQNMTRVNAQQSYFFSAEYFRALGALAGVELWLAQDAQGAAAGGIFIRHGDLVFYHFGATADRALAVSPLKYLLHHRIQALARAGGTRRLVLGGGVGGADDPLFSFKRGFSKLTQPVHALRVVFDPDAYARLCGPDALPISATGFFPAYRAPK